MKSLALGKIYSTEPEYFSINSKNSLGDGRANKRKTNSLDEHRDIDKSEKSIRDRRINPFLETSGKVQKVG